MVEAYHYVFSPLVNVSLVEERINLGASHVRRVYGATLERLWRWMQENNFDAGQHWANAEPPSEAAFLVKEYQVVEESVPCDDGTDDFNFSFSPAMHDVFHKERVCLNLSFDTPIATPIIFCSDDFPAMNRGTPYWSSPDLGDWEGVDYGDASWRQRIDEAVASAIRDLMVFQAEEFLDKRPWLKRALARYEKASCLRREPADQFGDYWKILEAVFTDKSKGKGLTIKLATRIAIVLAQAGEERERVDERIKRLKKLYGMSCQERHEAREIVQEEVPRLRRCARRSILAALELSRGVGSDKNEKKWDSRRKTLYEHATDQSQIEELSRIRTRWSAVW